MAAIANRQYLLVARISRGGAINSYSQVPESCPAQSSIFFQTPSAEDSSKSTKELHLTAIYASRVLVDICSTQPKGARFDQDLIKYGKAPGPGQKTFQRISSNTSKKTIWSFVLFKNRTLLKTGRIRYSCIRTECLALNHVCHRARDPAVSQSTKARNDQEAFPLALSSRYCASHFPVNGTISPNLGIQYSAFSTEQKSLSRFPFLKRLSFHLYIPVLLYTLTCMLYRQFRLLPRGFFTSLISAQVHRQQ